MGLWVPPPTPTCFFNLIILSVQFSGIKLCLHVVQPSLLFLELFIISNRNYPW